ncbi:response regulator transcription factor [Nautilia lithotrophica]
MKIIVIEDEETLNDALTMFLESEGYDVNSYYDLKSFFSSIYDYLDADLIIADISLPDGNFLQEMKKFPKISQKTKVMIISGQTEIENIRKAFNLGAEDFIKKPFDYEEILLRINKMFTKKNQKIINGVYYDFDSKALIKNNEKILLSKKESLTLELFLKNRGKILSPEYIMQEVWGEIVENNTLTVMIKRVREKIGDKKAIVSKRDLGYIMF